MSNVTPTILPGFLELLPQDQIRFNHILKTIESSFRVSGFMPMDTPIIEKLEILTSKGGGENEQQMYAFKKGDTEMALRFDLTVPLARYVSQHYHELAFPFKRYQIGKVFRGEKPQKGRFREFYQCDIDVVAKNTLDIFYDAEILATIFNTFKSLNFGDFVIKVNNKKLLVGYLESLDLQEKVKEVLRTIDKIDKIGIQEVLKNLTDLGTHPEAVNKIKDLISTRGSAIQIIAKLESLDIENELFLQGLLELKEFCNNVEVLRIPEKNWQIDLSIARGLDYYTGTIYETFLTQYPEIGSICSGGRYENLANNFSDYNLPGVGISIGLTRLFYKLQEAGIVQNSNGSEVSVLVLPLEGGLQKAMDITTQIRDQNIVCEIFIDQETNLKKKMDYANRKGFNYVCIIGQNEVDSETVTVKNMNTGEQVQYRDNEIVPMLI